MKPSRLVPATLLAASSLTVLSGAIVAPALPAMRAHFAEVEQAGFWVRLVLTLPALAIALAAPLAGYAVDRWGRRRLLAGAMLLYAAAGSSGLVLDRIGAILAGRAVLGTAVAMVMTASTALLADYYRGPERARFMGLQAGSMAFGGMIFLLAGGALADLSWRGPFAVYLLALLILPGVLALREPDRHAPVGDAGGAPLPASAPRGLLAGLYATGLLGMVAFYLTPTQIPFLVEQRVGAGALWSGAALAASTATGAVASLRYGRLRARLSHLAILGLTFAGMGAGYLVVGAASGYAAVVAGLGVVGLGMGLMMPNLNVWLTGAVPDAVRGRALGGLTTAVFLGQFLSPVASQPVAVGAGLEALFTGAGALSLALGALLLAATRLPRRGGAELASPPAPPAQPRTQEE